MITYWVNPAGGLGLRDQGGRVPERRGPPWQGHYACDLAAIPPLRGRPGGLAA